MKRLVAVIGSVGVVALWSPAFAAAGAIIVHNGQSVTLPCLVTGAVDVQAGGSASTGCEGLTTIEGTVDAAPGSQIDFCDATIEGSLLARSLVSPSLLGESTVRGATRADASLTVDPTGCTGGVIGDF
jgi:hypothetical protein